MDIRYIRYTPKASRPIVGQVNVTIGNLTRLGSVWMIPTTPIELRVIWPNPWPTALNPTRATEHDILTAWIRARAWDTTYKYLYAAIS